MPHTFISYVHEDAMVADYVARILRANGVEPWIDRERLGTGQRWKDELRRAIEEGNRFLPIFSRARAARERSVAEEELTIAIDELRRRPRNRAWFLPLKIDDAAIPNNPISGLETIRDLQYEDVPGKGWRRALTALLDAHGIERPILDVGEPIAPGFGDVVDIVGGRFVLRGFDPPQGMEAFEGVVFQVVNGYCERQADGRLVASFSSFAPSEALQAANERLGLAEVSAVADAAQVSTDPAAPTRFRYDKTHLLKAGTLIDLPGRPGVTLPIDMPVRVQFEADVHLNDFDLNGSFQARWDFKVIGNTIALKGSGDVHIAIRQAVRPPHPR